MPRRHRVKQLILLVAGLAGEGMLLAQDEVELFYSHYNDDAGLTAKSPGIIASKDLGEATTLGFKYLFENFSKSAPSSDLDAVSGATTVAGGTGSGFSENRHEVALSGSHRFDEHQLSAGYVRSTEEDFDSTGASVAYSRELFQRNLTLTALYGHTWDSVDKLDATAEEDFPKDKDTDSLTLSATQLLTRTALLNGGYSYAHVQGYQSNPTRRLVIVEPIPGGGFVESAPIVEIHPDQRDRHTFFVRGLKYFSTRSSADANFALYRDDWGVAATTVELRVNHYLSSKWLGRLRYRWYSQSEADFYQEQYDEPQKYMTADYRLRSFDSNLAGLKVTYYPSGARVGALLVSASYDRYWETNAGVEADVFQLSLRIPY
jgi:hypothetical protein